MTRALRWDQEWQVRDVVDDIRMRDFFGGRQFIAKYFPWWGTGLEAGCGLGRYVFYFAAMGRRLLGVDFSDESIIKARRFAVAHGFSPNLFSIQGLTDLTFEESSLSYYISLGVMEHFYEGPERPLAEAYRVLAPGGMILVTTPNKYSWEVINGSIKTTIKTSLRRIDGVRTGMMSHDPDGHFFQYWYSRNEVVKFIRAAGFLPMETGFVDIRYPFHQRSGSSRFSAWVFRRKHLLDRIENSPLRIISGSSIVVAMKPGTCVRCFFCGDEHEMQTVVHPGVAVPVCESCKGKHAATVAAYRRRTPARYAVTDGAPGQSSCAFCGCKVVPDPVFSGYGFDIAVCGGCVMEPEIRGRLCARHVLLNWQPYS